MVDDAAHPVDATTGEPATSRTWRTAPEIASDVSQLLALGDEDDALRFLLDGVLALRHLTTPDEFTAFVAPPGPTGDERWDALLAASIAYMCRQGGHPVPAWTARASLDEWWWPGHVIARRAQVVQRTPIDFRRLGIWFDERNFTAA